VEVAWRRNLGMAGGYTAVASSDAHHPELIGTKKSLFDTDAGDAGFETVVHALNKGAVTLHYKE
jgi:PHP domain-containing protein